MASTPLNITDAQRDVGLINRFARDTQLDIQELRKLSIRQQTAASVALETAALAALPGNIANGSVVEAGLVVDGILFSQLTCTYTAPTPLGAFAGIFIVVEGYRGNSELVKVGEHSFTGVTGGTASFNVVLQRTDETITVYFVSKNAQGRTINWALAPNTSVLLDGNNTATVSTVAIATVNASSAFTTTAFISQSGLTTTINISASTAQFGFGTVHYNSGTINPGSFGTWYIYADDPRYLGGAVTYAATSNFWIANAGEGRMYFGKVTTSGGGGGTGGCFSGNTCVKTWRGDIPIANVVVGDLVLTAAGTWRPVLQVLLHEVTDTDCYGPVEPGCSPVVPRRSASGAWLMFDIGNEEFITLNHMLLVEGRWSRAYEVFNRPMIEYKNTVFNLEIDATTGDPFASDTEQSYTLSNGCIVHNQQIVQK